MKNRPCNVLQSTPLHRLCLQHLIIHLLFLQKSDLPNSALQTDSWPQPFTYPVTDMFFDLSTTLAVTQCGQVVSCMTLAQSSQLFFEEQKRHLRRCPGDTFFFSLQKYPLQQFILHFVIFISGSRMKALQRPLQTFVVEQPLAYRETDTFPFSLPSI